MKTLIAVCIALISTVLQSSAIFVVGNSDNTNAPAIDGGGGFNSEGVFYNNTSNVIGSGVVIGTNHVVTVSHVTNVIAIGQTFRFRGSNYVITTNHLSPSGKTIVWDTSPNFPNGSWAQLYTNCDESTKEFYVFGCGPKKGNVITTTVYPSASLTITNQSISNNSYTFNVKGGVTGDPFVIQSSTNLVDWSSFSNICTVPMNQCMSVSVTRGNEQSIFFRTMYIPRIITNGWEMAGSGLGILRWGKNRFEGVTDGGLLYSSFDLDGSCGADESATWNYDSAGGGFLKNTNNGIYQLAALVEGSSSGDPYKKSTGEIVYGAMCDQSGLTLGTYNGGNFQEIVTFPTNNGPAPTQSFYVRISSEYAWLKQFAGK